MVSKLRRFFLGVPLNPFSSRVRQHISLIAMFAWIGLGADALSSSCYGPEQSFIAMGPYTHLALYVSVITVLTIFIISMGYNQVIELFPSGGGGYKVATKLLHPYVGLISGSALIVDYVLTITVSVASGADAFFSLLPLHFNDYKLFVEAIVIIILIALNMRGMKEAIQFLAPIFLGFVVTHFILIFYGIASHSQGLLKIIPITFEQTQSMAAQVGWLAVIGMTLHAYSLGSGTYTGLEAVSNNVNRLAEPRVETGKRAMLYMAISLSITAGGIILLYLLWNAKPHAGETLNAVVFHSILGDSLSGTISLVVILLLESGLLLVAANTGFAAGPNVLANMSLDGWLPNRFRHLSNRLVVQNGLILIGIAALAILFWTAGKVSLLVVLYSINVFITFSLSLLAISVYWLKNRAEKKWLWNFLLTSFAFLITATILSITIYFKFKAGGWVTLLITLTLVIICLLIKRHYRYVEKTLLNLDKRLAPPLDAKKIAPLAINPKLPTAVIFVNRLSVGLHALLTILRLFPKQFNNFVFLSAGAVDVESFTGDFELEKMKREVNKHLDYLVKYCHQHGLPAEAYAAFGTDTVEELKRLAHKINIKYANVIFFASQIVFKRETLLTPFLHSQTPLILQHHLHFHGEELMILPMRV